MLGLLCAIARALVAAFRVRSDLVIEVMALRQQLATLKYERPRPKLSHWDRLFWTSLRRLWPSWKTALLIVKPETVVRWHRAGFRLYWKRKSRPRGRPRVEADIRQLIVQMATENSWRAPRIHAELLKLGYKVSQATVSRYLPKVSADPDAIKRWKAFLRNHREVIAAMDLFTVPTFSFNVLYVFFIIQHGRRKILHIAVTGRPSADWVAQQLREAFAWETTVRYLIVRARCASRGEFVHLIFEGRHQVSGSRPRDHSKLWA